MAHRVAPRAETDLDDIRYSVAKESGSVDTITDRFFVLASFPYIGRSRDDDFGAGCRSVTVGEYVIVYSVECQDTCSAGALCLSRCGLTTISTS
jgi:plasmid stabilization system protein ParE